MTSSGHDVVVLGGGLAGLTLALQLVDRCPGIDVAVLERRRHPVPLATHKVGESSVEIAAHYFSVILGLDEHLTGQQLKKFGFRFFFSDGRSDVDRTLELGPSRYLATPAYQLDRGLFENFLGGEAIRRGVRFLDAATVRSIELSDGSRPHRVAYRLADSDHVLDARWLVDASGRAGLVKRKLGLARPNAHCANAAWFRLAARIAVDDWSQDPGWRGRCEPPTRWLSTNHLVGRGYWIWLIPLASGSHSIGIVADPREHPLEAFADFESALAWLARRQPRLAQAIEAKRDTLQDFAYLRDFSYDCRQVFSAQRWALTGEAGVFLDPFYSPGGDFIAIANTYITELVARDRAGESLERLTRLYEQMFRSFYENTLSLYVDQYPIFGDPAVLPLKVLWDYTYYWGVPCQLFFQQRLVDVAALAPVRAELAFTSRLNAAVQPVLRAWSAANDRTPPSDRAGMLDQTGLEWFTELNRGLRDRLDDAAFTARIRDNADLLAGVAERLLDVLRTRAPGVDTAALEAVLAVRRGSRDASPRFLGVFEPGASAAAGAAG
jgi:flavin-dependent dehydrogenase